MNHLRSLFQMALVLAAAAPIASGLTIKPNVAPVVQSSIGNRSQYFQTTGVIDLSPYFRDPDASAAVKFTTDLGDLKLTLDGETAPVTVANFLRYINDGRYYKFDPVANRVASVFFHRSVSNFVIQTGGFIGTLNPDGSGNILASAVPTYPAIQNEPVISNQRGTIAMAKTAQANSATSQWFVNLKDNSSLDDPSVPGNTGGFTVFGRVAGNGMSVVDAIAALPVRNFGSPFDELPTRNYTSPNPVRVENLVSAPAIQNISPFTFTATSNNSSVASVSTAGKNLLVVGNQVGSAKITVTASDLDGVSVAQSFMVNITAAPGRLRNIATRVNFPNGNEVLIGGFIIRGGTTKRLVVRGLGPSLAGAGIANALSNPTLELRDANETLIASNDNWVDSADRDLLAGIGLAPSDDRESALIVEVPSNATNASYSAIVRSNGNTPGVGLVEVYDLDSAAGSVILNLSTRGAVGTGNNVMIGGFISQGTDARRLVVRALGPSLTQFGVPNVLPDPTLELRDAQGTLVASNNNWQTHPDAAEIQGYGLAPSDSHESALVNTVPSGPYTTIVSGTGGQPSGTALLEIYQVQ